jgi:hypothetical protein
VNLYKITLVYWKGTIHIFRHGIHDEISDIFRKNGI